MKPIRVVSYALAGTLLAALPAFAQKQIHAKHIVSKPPHVDGRLDDPVWSDAQFVSGFTQRMPDEGEPAHNRSEIAVAYDDDAVYFAARLTCTHPDKLLSTVARRDNGGNSERIIISLDTYNDNRTAYTFAVTATGTRLDYYHGSDSEGSRDYDYDPVWQARTSINGTGWTAEMRIPFAQLRFRDEAEQTWGININRWAPSDNEDSYWILVPQDKSGWSSRMGDLVGISGIAPSNRVELLPYTAGDATFASEADPNNPFNDDGRTANARVGLDMKMGVGPNLTLDGTLNPDFGQVEADPADVNLTAYETVFDERRPFFTEGSGLFSAGGANYFYSRRIGAPPHGRPSGDNIYVDSPTNSTILGAGKLTGRLNSGLSVGALAAVTQHEKADVYDIDTGTTKKVSVEPMTAYGVARLKQEIGTDGSTVGIILTGVERDLSVGEGLADFMRDRAWTGGTDFLWELKDKEYRVQGAAGFSYIEGSEKAITAAQLSSARYFNRPDADYVELDTTATSMAGWVASLRAERNEGKFRFGSGIGFESPGFEINDIGVLGTADDIDWWAETEFRQTTPASFYQSYTLSLEGGLGTNFGGERQYDYISPSVSLTFKNFYGVSAGGNMNFGEQSDNQTRGGPSMGMPNIWNTWLNIWNPHNQKFQWSTYTSYARNEFDGWGGYGETTLGYSSGSRWQASVTPIYNYGLSKRQYVTAVAGGGAATYGTRYIFSELENLVMSMRLRASYAFTPDLTLEAYMEPFAASGQFREHGELEAARSKYLRVYGEDGTTITREADGSWTVTDGTDTFTIPNRDFNVVSFRSNLVLRWEFRPGSTMYFVWQQNRFASGDRGRIVTASDLGDSFSASGDNFFAVKIAYWLPF